MLKRLLGFIRRLGPKIKQENPEQYSNLEEKLEFWPSIKAVAERPLELQFRNCKYIERKYELNPFDSTQISEAIFSYLNDVDENGNEVITCFINNESVFLRVYIEDFDWNSFVGKIVISLQSF